MCKYHVLICALSKLRVVFVCNFFFALNAVDMALLCQFFVRFLGLFSCQLN